jgi:hypothetical protein
MAKYENFVQAQRRTRSVETSDWNPWAQSTRADLWSPESPRVYQWVAGDAHGSVSTRCRFAISLVEHFNNVGDALMPSEEPGTGCELKHAARISGGDQ